MTDEAEPGRPPAHDLAAFDLAKRSPEQLAQSFAQWKARRRPPQATANAATPAPKPPPAAADKAEKSTAPDTRAVAPRRGWARRSIQVQYSDPFSSLLAAGSEPAVQRIEPAPIVVARPSPRHAVSPGRRLKAMTILAGVASLVTLAGGALLEVSSWRDAEPKSAQIQPAAAPIARAATNVRMVAWTLKPMVDRALLKAVMPPAVQTASKADASSAKPAPARPAFKKAAPETVQFVAKPFIPNAAPAPQPFPAAARASIQTAPLATAIHAGDPRPDALFQHGRNQGDAAFSSRLASGSKPAATTKSNGAAQAPAARNGKTASAGGGDPRGESSGGAQADAGTEADGAPAAGDGNGSGSSNGGSASGDGNDGGADTGGSDGSGGDAGGSDGADSGQSDAGDSVGGDSGAGPADGASGGDSSPENADSDQGGPL